MSDSVMWGPQESELAFAVLSYNYNTKLSERICVILGITSLRVDIPISVGVDRDLKDRLSWGAACQNYT